MDLIHRPNKTITQFLSLSHTVGVHLKNFFCREDSRLTPQNSQQAFGALPAVGLLRFSIL